MPSTQQRSIPVSELTDRALLNQYLSVTNDSLERNADDAKVKPFIGAANKLLGNKQIAVGVEHTRDAGKTTWFTVGYDDGSFDLQSRAMDDEPDSDLKWVAKRDHMVEVVTNPEPYVDNPYRIDLDWLRKHVELLTR